jgi:predicted PurR-regulated permease PerM
MDDQKKRKTKGYRSTARAFYILLLVGISVLFFFIARKFIMAVLMAAITAGVFWPVHTRILTLLEGRGLSAAVAMVGVILIILVPIGIIGYFTVSLLLDFAQELAQELQTTRNLLQQISGVLEKIPVLRNIKPVEAFRGERIVRFFQQFGDQIITRIGSLTADTALLFIQIFIYLYSLFFFLKEGDRILVRVFGILPLQKRYQNVVIERFVSVTRSVLKSTFIIGSIQGSIGGMALYLLGLKGAVLWGVVLMFLAVIPDVGAVIVWLPASIVLFAKGNPIGGGIMILVGLVIALSGYILRPRLIGKEIRIHQILVLLGVLGGIALFGIFGFIIGPILMSLFVILWEMFREAAVAGQTE